MATCSTDDSTQPPLTQATAIPVDVKPAKSTDADEEYTELDDSQPQGKPPLRVVRSTRRREKHLANKEAVNLRLMDKSNMSFDWRAPLQLLKEHTQIGRAEIDPGEERILVHQDLLPAFAGDIGETIWDIKVRSGCEVQVLGKEDHIGVYRPVFVRGSPTSIELAKEAMLHLFQKVSLDIGGIDSDKILFGVTAQNYRTPAPSLVRKVWTKDQIPQRQSHVLNITRPRVWTTLNFADYVAVITRSTVSRQMQRYLYKDEDPHAISVAEKLKRFLLNPRHDHLISVRALNDTLRFLYKHNMVSTLRKIFVRVEHLKLQLLPETFNIMLRGAAAQKDLHSYTRLLQLMIRKGVRPNAGSWVALLMALPSRAVQVRIEESMRKKGLLDHPAAVKDVVAQIISAELRGHLSSGQNLESFFARMDKGYGPAWPSVSSLNRILDVVMVERGSFSQALRSIKLFQEEWGIPPNSVSLNILLSHCNRQYQLHKAVRLMEHMHAQFLIEPDERTYHVLFMLAWKCQQYNVCRVAWRHACVAGAVSYRMQVSVLRSLLRNTPTESKTKGQMWIASAGKVIVGIAADRRVVGKLVGWSEGGEAREENLRLAKEMLSQDLGAVRNYRPARHLVHDLPAALQLDLNWTRKRLWTSTSTIWKIENAMDISILPR